MSLNILKLQLIHKLSSNIDMIQLYKMSTLHKECFYQAINKNTDIIKFLKDLGFNVYNTEIYRKRILREVLNIEKEWRRDMLNIVKKIKKWFMFRENINKN